jgi:hypothetical protein
MPDKIYNKYELTYQFKSPILKPGLVFVRCNEDSQYVGFFYCTAIKAHVPEEFVVNNIVYFKPIEEPVLINGFEFTLSEDKASFTLRSMDNGVVETFKTTQFEALNDLLNIKSVDEVLSSTVDRFVIGNLLFSNQEIADICLAIKAAK